MRLHFDPGLPHQRDALRAVLDVFGGARGPARQPPSAIAAVRQNVLPAAPTALLDNLRAVQQGAGLPPSEVLPRPPGTDDAAPAIDLAVEMETGTGKTYTYLRTILELHRRHGFAQWLIIVPSIAVREGVLCTLRDTREHFRSQLPDVSYRFWAYDGRPERVRTFATSAGLDIGVLTIAAFNKLSNRLRRADDRFGGATPLSWIAASRPCLVLDEPHRYTSPLSKTSLSRLAPLVTLRFGATHREARGLVHRLDAAQAAASGLVKRVEIDAVPPSADDAARLSAQIERTVALHVERQARLAARGIKVLSLFFVERVADYADPDGLVRTLFDRHFEALKGGCPRLSGLPAARVRSAYFATKRGAAVETAGDTQADAAAYELIMRDKARLLSLDEPVAFVFSHSALREGWDNPNVFQVCTLAPRTSQIRRRQEIGRGVRLCVDQAGRRVADPAVDVLSVVPAEPYEAFIEAWRAEHDDGPERTPPPTPTRAGNAPPPVPTPAPVADEVVWVDIDSEALIRDATAALATAPRREGPAADARGSDAPTASLAAELLARREPTIVLSPRTVAAVVERSGGTGGASPEAVAQALAEALARQGG